MPYEPKNVLITGGAGFIASHVAILFAKKYPHCKVSKESLLFLVFFFFFFVVVVVYASSSALFLVFFSVDGNAPPLRRFEANRIDKIFHRDDDDVCFFFSFSLFLSFFLWMEYN